MKATSGPTLTDHLRDCIVNRLHLGLLHTGDRLASTREVAEETGLNWRTVAKAYRALEAEGLVEIRGRSGVYVAEQDRLDEELLPETVAWMAAVLTEARKRRIRVPEFHDFVRRCTVSVRVRCACVESTRDDMAAYCAELAEDWGFDVDPVLLDPTPHGKGEGPGRQRVLAALVERLRGADLITAPSFHASLLREVAEALGTPMVMLTTHPALHEAIRSRLEAGSLTFVVADRRFGERMRTVYGETTGHPDRLHVVMAEDAHALAALDRRQSVILTRAAHEQLGDVDLPLLFPHSPTLSPECERELAEVLVRLNRQGGRRSS